MRQGLCWVVHAPVPLSRQLSGFRVSRVWAFLDREARNRSSQEALTPTFAFASPQTLARKRSPYAPPFLAQPLVP